MKLISGWSRVRVGGGGVVIELLIKMRNSSTEKIVSSVIRVLATVVISGEVSRS
jgi:hypothetical protein